MSCNMIVLFTLGVLSLRNEDERWGIGAESRTTMAVKGRGRNRVTIDARLFFCTNVLALPRLCCQT
jgi:hypothetical protein